MQDERPVDRWRNDLADAERQKKNEIDPSWTDYEYSDVLFRPALGPSSPSSLNSLGVLAEGLEVWIV